jgi:thiamine pyrophosphate-dependent acetolactate synthase large subunit-like protein
MVQNTVAHAIIDRLVAEGSKYVFVGPPTSHQTTFVDALFDRQSEITPILVRHEALAAFMAEGWFSVPPDLVPKIRRVLAVLTAPSHR